MTAPASSCLPGPRTLTRRSHAGRGAGPLRWLPHRRVEHAGELLETTTPPVDRVARACGPGTAGSLRAHPARRTGLTPNAHRARFPRLAAAREWDRSVECSRTRRRPSPSPYDLEKTETMRVEIWSDIACPWCYVGKARFEKALAAFPHREEVEVVHRSFELDPGRAKDDVQPVLAMLTAKYGMSEEQARAGEDNLGAQAAAEGLPYRTRGRDHGATFDMHRLLHFAREHGRQEVLLDLLYRANFAEERSVFGDDERLVELAVAAGLDADGARAVLADPTAYADDVRADEREAAQLGARGVPFFVLDRALGVSGAQPAEVFTRALTQAWEARTPLRTVGSDAGDACGPDGCAVPQG